MTESNDSRAQSPRNLVDRPAAIAATQIASMAGLLVQKTEGRLVAIIRPGDTTTPQIIAYRFDGPQELTLLHRKCTDGKIYWRALLEQQQRMKKREGVFASRQCDRDTITIPDHPEAADRLTHFSQ